MSAQATTVRHYALCRAGDKSDTLNISVVARSPAVYAHLRRHVTQAFVADLFADRRPTRVTRYRLDTLHALNFVLEGALDGGVNRALHVDRHGKTLSARLLDAVIPPAEGWDGA